MNITPAEALEYLLNDLKPAPHYDFDSNYQDNQRDITLVGSTALCIVPGYEFRVVSGGLITNFHQPDSTLLLLVAAFLKSSRRLQQIYSHAKAAEYKFLSYGDSSIIVNFP